METGEQNRVALEFWFDFASPYSYLAASRIEALIQRAPGGPAIHLLWKPLLLGPIFQRRPHHPSPFQEAAPAEQRYRRRDIERLCDLYGLPLTWPRAYPRGSLLATRIALLAADEGWGGAFARAVFAANFAADRDIGSAEVIGDLLRQLGQEAETLLGRAAEPATKARLKAEIEQAMQKGIFGAPSFLVGEELFWGNDRLEQAIAWAAAL